jgi:hypothetical protein
MEKRKEKREQGDVCFCFFFKNFNFGMLPNWQIINYKI